MQLVALKLTLSRLEHPLKASLPMLVTSAPMVRLSRLAQPTKAPVLMVGTLTLSETSPVQ